MAGVIPSASSASAFRLDRARLFFWLYLIAALNSFAGLALSAVAATGWLAAGLNLMGISAILWVALAAGLQLLRAAPADDPPTTADIWVAALGLAAVTLPSATISSGALTLLALYGLATSAPSSPLRRSAIIFLTVAGATLWGRLLLALFTHPLLDLDAFLVARFVGVAQEGNVIAFADGSGAMAVAPGCSSLQGISLALVFWATVNQWFEVRLSGRALAWLGAAVAATVAVNVLRIAALAHFPEHFDSIHGGLGWHVAAWVTMILVAALCVYGARREIFD
ncbi:MAG TPA: archaeosortase/exosortase family protein [Allosphingosinicella sp.]